MERKKDKLNLSKKAKNNALNIYRLKDYMKRNINNRKYNKYNDSNNNRKMKTVIINNIIESKENHYIAVFKDHLIKLLYIYLPKLLKNIIK